MKSVPMEQPALRRATGGPYPLSCAQERLWFLEQLRPGNPAYHLPLALRFTGPVDIAALKENLQEVLRRHDALRATFPDRAGRPVQEFTAASRLDLPRVDLSAIPAREREIAALQRLAAEVRRPFDLIHGPLVRAVLLRLSDQEHLLLLTAHEMVVDDWSMRLLVWEIAIRYQAALTGRPARLPDLPVQYGDFAAWQRQWLQEGLEAQLAYWKERLRGTLPTLELPADRARPAVQSFRGARQRFTLPPRLTEALRTFSRQEQVPLAVTLLAAFETLLHRYSGQDDLLVGTCAANRRREEFQGLVGRFANTLVLRTDMSGDPSFRELLVRVREVLDEANAHQEVPFERLVEELQPERDLGRPTLCQAMFRFQGTEDGSFPAPLSAEGWLPPAIELPGLTLTPLELDGGTARVDLRLSMIQSEQDLSGWLEYSADLFDAATVVRMHGHFQTLLEGIVADPEQPLSLLPMLTEAEQHQLLVEWNDTQADYPRDQCFHQLFEQQVARMPDAVAAIYGEQRLTYRELNERANQLAHFLRTRGVGPEVLVGICVERSLEMLVGLLGILKAGGAYLPLDPAYPQERLAFMIADARTPVLLTQQRLVAMLPQQAAQVIRLDADGPALAGQSRHNPVCTTTPQNLAYVIYTSGSTGQPKGVMIPHRGLVNYLCWCIQAYAAAAGCGSPVHSPLGFDLSITSLFSPLLVGRSVTLVPEAPGIEALGAALLAAGDYSLVKITPAHLAVLGQCLPAEAAAGRTRALIIGGEALGWEQLAFWQQHAPETRLINEYGPTETVVGCCVYEAPAHSTALARGTGSVPIGRPIANTRLYVLDRHLNPVPIGVPGELYIGGDGVGRGYLNRPELTAERFISDPFSAEPGAPRLYKSGDLARYLPDGNLEFLGRMDDQVKIRGYRIELGEIEAALAQHPAVAEAVVLVREDEPGDKRLTAYVVPHSTYPGAREPTAASDEEPEFPWLDWQQEALTVGRLRKILADKEPAVLGIRRVPNARLAGEVRAFELLAEEAAIETVGDLRQLIQDSPHSTGIDPEELWRLGEELPYSVEIFGSGVDASGCFDVVFRRRAPDWSPAFDTSCAIDVGGDAGRPIWSAFGNNPWHGLLGRRLAPELRRFLQEKVPDYMVPSAFVRLDALPLTSNGKVDRRALPAPDQVRPELDRLPVAPRNPLESRLARIWEQVLGIQPVGVRDGFFDLGGHSLLAVRLFMQIEQAFGRKLPLATLFQAPTVEQLASILDREGWSPSWSSLVAIQPHGTRPPFFCVHGVGGNVLNYYDLSRHLDPDQPFYGLQAPGLDGNGTGPTRIEELAALYIRDMRTVQPEGPYFLGGLSFGGLVAYEMAQQLQAQDQKVALLALFDTEGPGYPRFPPLVVRITRHLQNITRRSPKAALLYLWVGARDVTLRVQQRIHAFAYQQHVSRGSHLPDRLRSVEMANSQAARVYVPQVYPGRMTLFRASEQPALCYEDPCSGWGELVAGGIEIHEIPGNHHSIVQEPHVRILAGKLRACLDRTQADWEEAHAPSGAAW